MYKFTYIFVFTLFLGIRGDVLAQSTEVEENRLVVIVAPGKLPEAIRAATVEIRDLVVVTKDQADKRSAWQRDFYKGSAPLFPLEQDDLTIDQIDAALAEYQVLAKKISASKELLDPEESKWRDKRLALKYQQEKDASEKQAALEAKVDDFLERPYDLNGEYEIKMLDRLIELGESLSQQVPDRAEAINHFLKPWKNHAENLRAGKVLIDGSWTTPQDLQALREAKALEAMTKFLDEGLKLTMESVVVPQTSVLLVAALIVMTLVLVLYMFLWLASSRGGTLTFGGALFMIFGLVVLGGYLYYGYKIFNASSTITDYVELKETATDEADRRVLQRALFVASSPAGLKLQNSDIEIKISDIQLNKLLQNNTEFVREGESELFDMERVAFAVLFFHDRVVFLDEAVVFGKSFLIRHELVHRITDELISFDGVTVYLGDVKLPGQLINFFWMKLRKDLKAMIHHTGMSEIYEISNIEEGSISLIMTRKPQMPDTTELSAPVVPVSKSAPSSVPPQETEQAQPPVTEDAEVEEAGAATIQESGE